MEPADIVIRPARPDEVIALRHRVLRAGLPRETAVFEGDDLPTTRHLVAVEGGDVIGCVTIVRAPWDGEPAWQLRGMAVDPARRGAGVGRALLAEAEAEAARDGSCGVIWCNARTPASPFYARHGWAIRSGEFVIETAGPHVKMTKRLRDGHRGS